MKARTKALRYTARAITDYMQRGDYNNYICNRIEENARPQWREALELFLSLYETVTAYGEREFVYNGRSHNTFNGASNHNYRVADEHRLIALCLAAVISEEEP